MDDDILTKVPKGKELKSGLIGEFEDGGYSYAYKKVRLDERRAEAEGWSEATARSY